MKRFPLSILLILAGLLPAPARSAPPARRVVLALVPAVSAADLNPKTMPHFRRLVGQGAVGLMNTRTAALPRDPDAPDTTADPARGNAYLTLGAGTRCAVGPPGAEGFAPGETLWEGSVDEVYARRNLLRLSDGGLQVNPVLIGETNIGMGYRADPGALGDLLRRHGVKTAVIGDADRPGEVHREGLLTAMDSGGGVDTAFLQTSAPQPSAPFGRSLSLPGLERALKTALSRSRFVVLDWGDTARLDDQRLTMLPRADAAATRTALKRLDGLFGLLSRNLDFRRDRLLVVSPYPARKARSAYDGLCPVLLVGGGTRPGLLTSPTTRRMGVVANVDVAPTVAAAFGITALPSAMVGRPMASAPNIAAWDRLLALRERQLEVERERRSVLRDIVSLLTWGLALLALLFLASKGRPARWLPLTLAFLPPAVPLALLILAYAQFPSVGVFTLALWAVTLPLAGAASFLTRVRQRAVDGIAFLVLATAALVIADGLAGFPHMPTCILSYSLMEGARYYGIGNEYMGSFLAATALAGTALFTAKERTLSLLPRAGVAGLFLLATLVLAGPAFGAKFGGGVAAAGGFGVCLLLLSLRRFKARHLIAILLGIAAVITLMVVLDGLRGGHSSHIGRAFAAIRAGGWGELGMIVQRKAGMNLRLLMFSPWSRLMGAGLLATVAACLARRSRRLPALPEGPLGAGVAGALAAALVAFLVDDAGVLAAATALIFIPPTLLAADRDGPGLPPAD